MPPQAQEPPTSMPPQIPEPQDQEKSVPEIEPSQDSAGSNQTIVQNITYNIHDSAISGDVLASAGKVSNPAGPPLPATGLPEGWSMEQWAAYGHLWWEQNGP